MDYSEFSMNEQPLSFRQKLAEFLVPENQNGYLPKILGPKYLFWYGLAVLLLKIAVLALIIILPTTRLFSDITGGQLLSLVNQARQQQNLSPLSLNQDLNEAAGLKAADMVNKDYFDHTSPSGLTPWHWFKQAGYKYSFAGENLAMDFWESRSVFNAWMASPTHRANILNPHYTEMGLAVTTGAIQSHEATVAVLTFGAPAAAAKTNDNQPLKTSASPTPSPSTAEPTGSQQSLAPTPETSALPAQMAQTAPNASASPAVIGFSSQKNPAPQVLGVFVSRAEQMTEAFYLYFILFLLAALGVNIFVKISVQRWGTIIATSCLILLAGVLIYI